MKKLFSGMIFLMVCLLSQISVADAQQISPWSEAPVRPTTNSPEMNSQQFFSAEDFNNVPAVSSIPSYDSLPKKLKERIGLWRQISRKLLAEAPNGMAAAGSCEAYSVLWLQRLAQDSYPLYYAQTSGVGEVVVDGKVKKLDKIHVFVVDRGLCSIDGDDPAEIIICPTWTQFFEPGECLFEDSRQIFLSEGGKWRPDDELTALPPVFVGTRNDLVAVYRKFQSRLRSAQKSGVDIDAGRYEPASLASLHYSFGINNALRTNILLTGQ